MNITQIIAALQLALAQGGVASSQVLIKLADGSLHQISEIDLILGNAELGPVATAAPAAFVQCVLS